MKRVEKKVAQLVDLKVELLAALKVAKLVYMMGSKWAATRAKKMVAQLAD